ncbi:MFS inorganic phosphate transporter [Hysterangium stoloniferum]|nr:MFS inorganic phosphate transporter [Hysterangium stoloniferum]
MPEYAEDDDFQRQRGDISGGLEASERDREDKPPYYLTSTEVKLLGISGVGFFLDAYDLFIINQVTVMLQYVLYNGNALPKGLHGLVNAGANIGSVIGQFTFGYLADAFGRKAVYGKELMIIIFATIMTISAPTGPLLRQGKPDSVLIWLIVWRIILGIGVGGDYPMSASVSSDRVSVRKRGTMLAYVFANQGWGSFVGSLATMVVLAAYKHVMNDEGKISRTDGTWRIVVGISLVPAFGTLYHRLTLPEARRYVKAKKLADGFDEAEVAKLGAGGRGNSVDETSQDSSQLEAGAYKVVRTGATNAVPGKKQHFAEFASYFSEWRHFKILLGTCLCWFLLDIAFYGINLNQSVVLQEIGFGGKTGTAWHKLWETALGNLIITSLGFVPGYYVTVFTVEYLGRKWIQIQGFLMAALFLGILAGRFHELNTASFVVCFAFLQFFFNFGANATTYLYPAEVFPTRFRATAHGISAASGKAGAIISSLGFNALTNKIGTPNVLWIFFGCCIAGAACTLLLPEVKGRDPDEVDAQEINAARARGY